MMIIINNSCNKGDMTTVSKENKGKRGEQQGVSSKEHVRKHAQKNIRENKEKRRKKEGEE